MNASTLRSYLPSASLLPAAVCTALACTAFAGVPNARAADASSWDGDARSAMRLIAGNAAPPGDALRAGVEIHLATGWKTYWRYPGDSGVPPAFDFSKSENVKSVAVMWPAPHRFTDAGDTSIGYKGDVVLPLRITAADPKRPVTLRLGIDYAVCEKLCVPAKGSASLDLTGARSANEAALAAAEARVPKPAQLGDAAPLAIKSVRRESGGPRPRVIVDVEAPAGAPLDLFVEGPAADWALPVPEPVETASGPHRFAFELDGLPPGATAEGASLRYTAVAGDRAIDVTAALAPPR
jgi:DsbC/DsbD-like thiol-disulfide interchange protein